MAFLPFLRTIFPLFGIMRRMVLPEGRFVAAGITHYLL
jgi:hypothetical protein